jgi:plastocyanin
MNFAANKVSRALIALTLLSLLVSACSGSAYPSAPAPTATPASAAPTSAPAASPAKTAAVEMQNFAFNPPTLQVTVGTKVTWTNKDGVGHSTTSDTNVWDSGLLANGASFSHTFSQAGTFPFYCKPHGGPGGKGMSGTITVVP